MACDPNQDCPICDRMGLPIFPVRYAVARATGVPDARRAPRLEAPFAVDDVALPTSLAHYTLRMSRQGYLYVFNEARAEWSGYVVSESGHLLPFNVDLPAPPPAESATPCARMAQSQAGRCIVIPDAHDPALLGKIWLAFSDSAWTRATLEKHRADSHRRQHMRCFDAAAWVAGNGATAQPHAARLIEAMPQVAELGAAAPLGGVAAFHQGLRETLGHVMGANPFMHSLTPPLALQPAQINALRTQVQQAVQVQVPRSVEALPVVLALDDPSGIGADLNLLIQGLAIEWQSEPERHEKLETATTIQAIRRAIENGAAEEARQERRDQTLRRDSFNRLLFGTSYRQLAGPRDAHWSERIDEAAELSEEEQIRVGEARWRRYHRMLKGADEATRAEWQRYLEETFPAELADFEASTLNPLDDAYVAWLDSPRMKAYFRLNFDPLHFENGIDYSLAFLTLIQESTGRRKVLEHLAVELEADPQQEDAVTVRALLGNHEPAIALWVEGALDRAPVGSEPDWAAAGVQLFGSYVSLATAASAAPAQVPLNTLGRVAMQLSGPMLKLLGEGWDGIVAGAIRRLPEKRVLSLLTMLGQTDASPKRVMAVHAQLTRKEAARTLSGMLAHYSGQQPQVFRSAGRAAYGALPAAGDPRFDIRGFVLIDTEAAQALDTRRGMGLSRSGHLQAVGNVMRPESFDHAMRRASRELLNAEFRGQLLGGVLVALTLTSTWREMEKVGAGANAATANFGAGVAVLTGSVFEGAAAVARRTTWGSTPLARPISLQLLRLDTRAAIIGFAGRVVGAVGGAIGGILSFKEGLDNVRVDQLYGVSMMVLGLAGVASGLIILFASTALIPIAFVIGILVAALMLVVGFLKPDEIQVWLSRARNFGKNADRSGAFFDSIGEQRAALQEIQEAGTN